MGGASREGGTDCFIPVGIQADCSSTAGKVKPLKAPKKDKKDLDDDDLAYKEKQKAGKSSLFYSFSSSRR